jgi:hypothetical protein
LVGGTGLAPARAFAHEFLRLACMHCSLHRPVGTRSAHPSQSSGLRHLRALRSVHHSSKIWYGRRDEAKRRWTYHRYGAKPRVSVWRNESIAPSRAFAHRLLAPARMLFRHVRIKWIRHGAKRRAKRHAEGVGRSPECEARVNCAPLFPIPLGYVATYALPE